MVTSSIMNEDYMHSDCNLIYIDENIPGPREDSPEYESILSNFNSSLTHHCKCDSVCTIQTCNCLMKSGDANYTLFEETPRQRLNFLKNNGNVLSFPIIECNSSCKCSEHCGNRVVEKGPINGLVVETCSDPIKGKGLFTTKFIPRGTFICEYAGEILTLNQAVERHNINQINGKMNYIFCLNEYCDGIQLQTIVDPSTFGNIGRYINHSCEPNCVIIPVRFESPLPKLAVFSHTDVLPNSEITYDYGSNSFSNSEEVENKKKCLCGCKNCTGLMPYNKY